MRLREQGAAGLWCKLVQGESAEGQPRGTGQSWQWQALAIPLSAELAWARHEHLLLALQRKEETNVSVAKMAGTPGACVGSQGLFPDSPVGGSGGRSVYYFNERFRQHSCLQ